MHILKKAVEEPVFLENGLRISQAPIKGGHVFWQEDVRDLLGILDKLSDTREELQSYGALLQEENKQTMRRRRLEEQKRLYGIMREKTAPQMSLLATLTEELQSTQDEHSARRLLGQIAVGGAYLKRRSNLIFLAYQTDVKAEDELRLCLNESATNLRLCGVDCAHNLDFRGRISLRMAAELYDFFETVVELVLNSLSAVMVVLDCRERYCRFSLMLQCEQDLMPFIPQFPDAVVSKADGIWYCTLTISKGDCAA